MTGERAAYLRVGLLLVAGLGLLLGLIWFLGGMRIGQSELAESYFSESVQGLEIGAGVKYRGVTLGRVTDIGLVSVAYDSAAQPLDAHTRRLVFVRYAMDRATIGQAPDVAAAVKLGLRVRLAAQGITGLSYLELDFVDPARYPALPVPWQPRAVYIPAIPSTLSQVQNAAQQVLAKLNSVDIEGLTASLTGLIGDLRQQVSQGGAHEAVQQIAELAQSLRQTVAAADVPGMTADLRRTSAALRDVVQGDALRDILLRTDQAATAFARAAVRLPPLIAALQATTRRADDSVADLQQALLPLLRDLQATAGNLRETSEMLRRNPAQLLSAPPPRTPEPVR